MQYKTFYSHDSFCRETPLEKHKKIWFSLLEKKNIFILSQLHGKTHFDRYDL